MVRIIPEPSFPSITLLCSSPNIFFRQLYTFLSYWINTIRTGHVGHPCLIRSTGQIIREQQPLTTKLRNILHFSTPSEIVGTIQAFQYYLHNNADVSGNYESSAASKPQIRLFIDQYNIDMSEFDPSDPDAYDSFDDFFVRTFRPGARPLADPDNDVVTVAVAEAKVVAYDSVSLIKKYWINGRSFSIFSLLGTSPSASLQSGSFPSELEAAQLARTFDEGSVSVYRLSQQDYHHYHSPVSGKVIYIRHLLGNDYGVFPLSVHSSVSVLDSNTRTTVIVISAENYGQVLFVAIGASQVDSVDVKLGDKLRKGDEVGNFMYGRSSIFVAFQKGKVVWDEDIREASLKGLMVDVKVLEKVGECVP